VGRVEAEEYEKWVRNFWFKNYEKIPLRRNRHWLW